MQGGLKTRRSSKQNETDIEGQEYVLTVGTTAFPNLAKRGKRAGKSIPLSQILAPPAVDPESGFTSVRVGARSLSLGVVWSGSSMMPRLEPVSRRG